MAWKTPRQRTQAKLWLALGTVKGFNGWLNNLESAVNATSVVAPVFFQTVDRLRIELKYLEVNIRTKMKESNHE